MDLTNPAPLSLLSLSINLVLCLVLSILLAWYYRDFGETLSNRSKFAPILPILSLITLLVISIVKSSLALSLGLVGALSIVRFRTAIKDPEELIFLFFAIAIGLGMGADQRIPTVIAYVIIMGYLLARKMFNKSFRFQSSNSLYLNIAIPGSDNPDGVLTDINQTLKTELNEIDLRRFDVNNEEISLTYYIQSKCPDEIGKFTRHIRDKYTKALISVVEQNNLLGG